MLGGSDFQKRCTVCTLPEHLPGGKSAIMTGMLVGLGGKAATTNRGNSLKGFIKDECK